MDEVKKDDFVKPKRLANPFLPEWNGIRPGNNFSPNGMMLPRELQPPPMYGPRGSTIPPRFLSQQQRPSTPNTKREHHKPNHSRRPKEFDGSGPRNSEFWCETCDRDFTSVEMLNQHKSEHKKCDVDGCKFVGHPAIVEKHIEMQHKSGLYDKIKKLSTPEEIADWRQERKKRYPSQRNVELRQKAQNEKTKRGERLNEPKNRFGDRSGRGKGKQFDQTKGKRNNNNRGRNQRNFVKSETVVRPPKKTETPPVVEVVVEVNEINDKLPRFKGTGKLEEYKTLKKENQSTSNPLAALVGMYGSDSNTDESDDEPEAVKPPPTVDELEEGEISGDEVEEIPIERSVVIEPELSSCEEPEECRIERPPPEPPQNELEEIQKPSTSSSRKRKRPNRTTAAFERKIRTTTLDYSKLRNHQPNTLLSKLLETEIRHERNVLLQCVRFVVENDFFGVGRETNKNT